MITKNTADLSESVLNNIAAIKETKWGIQIEFFDRQKAIEMLARYHGMLSDHLLISKDISVNVEDFTDPNYKKDSKLNI